MAMERFMLLLAFTLATVAADLRGEEHDGATPRSAQQTERGLKSPRPLILQEGDGEHLVRPAGPTGGWPCSIKLDGQNGNTEDFLLMAETMAPGQTIPFHKHDNAEEILILEEGGATVIVGDKWAVAGPRSIVFIPRDTWVSATNAGKGDIHVTAVFSRHGFERHMRAISVKQGEPLTPIDAKDLPQLRAQGHAIYWDTSKEPYPPGVAHP
jgi:quercetin dioxygenase-like cupin family protein